MQRASSACRDKRENAITRATVTTNIISHQGHVHCIPVCLAIDCHCANPQLVGGLHHTAGYLPTIGHQQLVKQGHIFTYKKREREGCVVSKKIF